MRYWKLRTFKLLVPTILILGLTEGCVKQGKTEGKSIPAVITITGTTANVNPDPIRLSIGDSVRWSYDGKVLKNDDIQLDWKGNGAPFGLPHCAGGSCASGPAPYRPGTYPYRVHGTLKDGTPFSSPDPQIIIF
jgi:hypothetical protein